MKKIYVCEMDEEEVVQTIANYFNVSRDKVKLNVGHEVIGVGPMERERHYVECRVELPANQTR